MRVRYTINGKEQEIKLFYLQKYALDGILYK